MASTRDHGAMTLKLGTEVTGMVGTPTMMSGIKPHYLCNKEECIQELRGYGTNPRKDLTLPELRVLVRRGRQDAGLVSQPPGKDKDIMAEINGANAAKLKHMAEERCLPCTNKMSVGEYRMILRSYVIQSGTADTEVDFGKHRGMTFQQVRAEHPEYVDWAVAEVKRSCDPHWQLQQLATWANKVQTGAENEEEMIPVGDRPGHLLDKAVSDVTWEGDKARVPTTKAPGSSSLQELQDENQALRKSLQDMRERLQQLELQNKASNENSDKRSRT